MIPTDRLASLIDQLMKGRVVGRDVKLWLLIGLLRYASSPDSTLDDCLGLVAPGQRRFSSVAAQIQRNEHLSRAVDAISIDPNLATWPRCQRLAVHVAELVKVWSRDYRHVASPSEAWPEWKRCLFRAWRTGRKIPASDRGIYEALKKSGIKLQSDAATLLEFNMRARSRHAAMVRNSGTGQLARDSGDSDLR